MHMDLCTLSLLLSLRQQSQLGVWAHNFLHKNEFDLGIEDQTRPGGDTKDTSRHIEKNGLIIGLSIKRYRQTLGEDVKECIEHIHCLGLVLRVMRTPNLTALNLNIPNLRTLYLAGDTNSSEDCSKIPPARCALESVTFELCMSNFEKLAPMCVGSANSLKIFEAWTMRIKEIDAVLRNVLSSIESIHIGGCNHPSKDFILGQLSNAPRLQFINLNGETDTGGRTRKGFAEAVNRVDSFPPLRKLSYPGERGTYKTGRGRNVRVHEYENVGAKELEETAKKSVLAELVSKDL
ncbi:hypothetical protein EDD85DRAFT_939860 [Armillaria nabsnona]|nr:hypothetical protein EDD85DRAFT_939860 [Armillaria nabsnona]